MNDSIQKIDLYGGAFSPPGINHWRIAGHVKEEGAQLVIVPSGPARKKSSMLTVSGDHLRKLVALGFAGLSHIEIDFYDLDCDYYSTTWELNDRYRTRHPHADIRHVIGADLVKGGKDGQAEIQRDWFMGDEVWRTLQFIVVASVGFEPNPADMPPQSRLVTIPDLCGRSSEIRHRICMGRSFDHLVLADVHAYIAKHRLYGYASEGK